jgi:thioester reductase-like protein
LARPDSSAFETVLLTGATGFVGRELLWRLARRPSDRVVCLLRAKDDADADARLARVLDHAQPEALTADQKARVTALRGDLTQDDLGLSPRQRNELAGTVTRVIHGAATVDWATPLETARQINVEGTRRVVELAKLAQSRGGLLRFDYISTCHVCGRRRGSVPEESLDDGYGFFNHYERSKFEAERLVRASGLPFATFRLSSVVGDSRTGFSSTFKVMYWPLKMLSRGMAWVVPADRRGIVDIVPVDYVCDALEAISAEPSQRGKTFHLAAGPDYSSTVGQLLDLGVKSFRVRPPLLVSPSLFFYTMRPLLYMVTWGKRREMLRKGRVYVPYFSFRAAFDTSVARGVLESRGLRPPLVQEYFQKLIDYAIASDWGKREPGRGAIAGTQSGSEQTETP